MAPQHPLLAEKSFPLEFVSVITCKFTFPHFGHCIFLLLLYEMAISNFNNLIFHTMVNYHTIVHIYYIQ